MSNKINFPRQNLPEGKKNKEWRKQCVQWAEHRGSLDCPLVRTTIHHKRVNYDLISGRLHMSDMMKYLNPYSLDTGIVEENIQHYPIINSKINVLRGEEYARGFNYNVIVTNPNAVSELEEQKKEAILDSIMGLLQQSMHAMQAERSQMQQQGVEGNAIGSDPTGMSMTQSIGGGQMQTDVGEELNAEEQKIQKELEKVAKYYSYNYQDVREIIGNAFLRHYSKENNFDLMFNKGFMDAMICAEEIYQCDVVSGMPIIEKVDPLKVRVYKSGNSNRIEDADIIVIEDYVSPSMVIDTYHEVLSPKDIQAIENGWYGDSSGDSFWDDTKGFINARLVDSQFVAGDSYSSDLFGSPKNAGSEAFDSDGNIRLLKVYWKSKRKVKKITRINVETGQEEYAIEHESYQIDPFLGETEKILWISEAWEGTLIGKDIFVNMRPRPIQYNRLSNPSECHFGIIGSIYNIDGCRPYSLVDMMKPYNYLYNAVHDKLVKLLEGNLGKIITLDLAKVPKGWDVSKWMHFIKVNNIAVVDSFKEGNIGASTGKLAGGLNNATSGVIDAELGHSIQANIQLLEYIKTEMSDAIGISRQREGQIFNRETVGGVERSNLQSSHITEWVFAIHEDVKKRVLECFLETAKMCLLDNPMKFQYILPDMERKIYEMGGDFFAEADYGIVVDDSSSSRRLSSNIDMLAQAAMQNQMVNFSSIIKLYSSNSISEKQKIIEIAEQEMMQRQQEAQQQQQQMQQQQLQAAQQQQQAQLQFQDMLSQREAETRIEVAKLQAEASLARNQQTMEFKHDDDKYSEEERIDMQRKKDEHTDKMALEEKKLEFEKNKFIETLKLKRQQLNKR